MPRTSWRATLQTLPILALAACSSGGGGGGEPALTALTLTPSSGSVTRGLSLQLTATGSYDNGTQKDVSALVQWSTSNAAVATVSMTGIVSTLAAGTVTISAALGGISQGATVTVNPIVWTVTVAPATFTFPLNRTLRLAAVAWYEDGTNAVVTSGATWASSATSAMTVAGGTLTPGGSALAGDSSTISATFQGHTGSSAVTLAAASTALGPGIDSDPLIDQQWHLHNTGQNAYAANAGTAGYDIAATATYAAGYAGTGVKVAVLDSGLEIAHEDLAANVASGSWNFSNGTSNPTSTSTTGDHGTSVAGLIAAVHGNALGGVGVAPSARLNGYNLIAAGNQTEANFVAALGAGTGGAGPHASDVWIFNQSFGISSTAPVPLAQTIASQYSDGVTNLRGGLGAVYVKSAGNGFLGFSSSPGPDCTRANALGLTCQNASNDPYNTLPMNLVVGALNADGRRSSYSTAGSAIWLSAFGGEYGLSTGMTPCGGTCPTNYYHPAMITTDQSGCAAGYSVSSANTSAFNAGAAPNTSCNYTNTMNGTSSAAPVTSGVVALLLEANPSLTWRDVKHILASTARQVDAAVAPVTVTLSNGAYVAELGWTTNAAGHKFHNWYGFGMIDADSAIAMAKTYAPGQLGKSRDTGWIDGAVPASNAIPDNSTTGASGTATIGTGLTIEAVMLQVTTDHTWLGDLGVELRSPSGTKSILLNTASGYGPNSGNAVLLLASNAFYGEPSAGTWTLKVVDGAAVDTGHLLAWRIVIFGH